MVTLDPRYERLVYAPVLPGSTVTFEIGTATASDSIERVDRPDAWRLVASSRSSRTELFDSGVFEAGQLTAHGLPTDGSTIQLTLYLKKDEVWTSQDFTFTSFSQP